MVAVTLRPTCVFGQAATPSAVTLGDRERVTVMRLTGTYDHDIPERPDAELMVRKAVAREYFRTHADDVDFLVVLTRFGYVLGTDADGARVGGRYYGLK